MQCRTSLQFRYNFRSSTVIIYRWLWQPKPIHLYLTDGSLGDNRTRFSRDDGCGDPIHMLVARLTEDKIQTWHGREVRSETDMPGNWRGLTLKRMQA